MIAKMHNYLFIILFISTLTFCGQAERTYYDTGELKTEWIEKDEIMRTYYRSGAPQQTIRFTNGVQHGLTEEFSEDSLSKTHIFMDEGKWIKSIIYEHDGNWVTTKTEDHLITRFSYDGNITLQFAHRTESTATQEFNYQYDSTLILTPDSTRLYKYLVLDFSNSTGILVTYPNEQIDSLTHQEFSNLKLFKTPWN